MKTNILQSEYPFVRRLYLLCCLLLLLPLTSCKKDPVIWSHAVVRGPYLQMLGPDQITVKWRTGMNTESVVYYGNAPSALNLSVRSQGEVKDHEVRITGLQPSTKYYYSFGTSDHIVKPDSGCYFVTSPLPGTQKKTRIWATGDAGSGYPEQNMVRDAFLQYTGSAPADLWLWLGDNAYEAGTDKEFQEHVFHGHFENIMKNTCVWPVIGNHDFANKGYQGFAARTKDFPYLGIFSLPEKAELGGIPSGTEHYYSFDYGNIHFIALDSYGSYNDSGSEMYQWLVKDLGSNKQSWTIVFFHHPPYSKGHDSDREQESIDMRQNIVPVLEQYGVDLVLSGHSHVYERSYLLNGHYGPESSLTPGMILDKSSGRPPSPYVKSGPGYRGTVYVVAGASGKGGSGTGSWPHEAMFFSDDVHNGSLVIDVDQDLLTASYVDISGTVRDEFSIRKQ